MAENKINKLIRQYTQEALSNFNKRTTNEQCCCQIIKLNGDGTGTLPDGTKVAVREAGMSNQYSLACKLHGNKWATDNEQELFTVISSGIQRLLFAGNLKGMPLVFNANTGVTNSVPTEPIPASTLLGKKIEAMNFISSIRTALYFSPDGTKLLVTLVLTNLDAEQPTISGYESPFYEQLFPDNTQPDPPYALEVLWCLFHDISFGKNEGNTRTIDGVAFEDMGYSSVESGSRVYRDEQLDSIFGSITPLGEIDGIGNQHAFDFYVRNNGEILATLRSHRYQSSSVVGYGQGTSVTVFSHLEYVGPGVPLLRVCDGCEITPFLYVSSSTSVNKRKQSLALFQDFRTGAVTRTVPMFESTFTYNTITLTESATDNICGCTASGPSGELATSSSYSEVVHLGISCRDGNGDSCLGDYNINEMTPATLSGTENDNSLTVAFPINGYAAGVNFQDVEIVTFKGDQDNIAGLQPSFRTFGSSDISPQIDQTFGIAGNKILLHMVSNPVFENYTAKSILYPEGRENWYFNDITLSYDPTLNAIICTYGLEIDSEGMFKFIRGVVYLNDLPDSDFIPFESLPIEITESILPLIETVPKINGFATNYFSVNGWRPYYDGQISSVPAVFQFSKNTNVYTGGTVLQTGPARLVSR